MLRFTAVPDVRTSLTVRGTRARTDLNKASSSNHAADPLESTLGAEQLFDRARDALVVSELGTGRILRWNPSAEILFGYSAADAVGRPVQMLMPPAVARLHRERVAHFERSGEDDVLD